MTFTSYPSLAGRVVFITGGGSGIGETIVEAFVANLALVAVIGSPTSGARHDHEMLVVAVVVVLA